jgi:hypothetical protein
MEQNAHNHADHGTHIENDGEDGYGRTHPKIIASKRVSNSPIYTEVLTATPFN